MDKNYEQMAEKLVPEIIGSTTACAQGVRNAEVRSIKNALKQAASEAMAEIEGKVEGLKKIGKSTHGNCCSCQKCHNFHDECACERNDAIDDVLKIVRGEV